MLSHSAARQGRTPFRSAESLVLRDGSSVAVVGGGPAGSLCAYFLLEGARQLGFDLRVDVYEPRDFSRPGPVGCNMCGGVVSEALVSALAADGITLPATVVQREITSYVLTTGEGSVRIEMPSGDRRIAALHRGAGPLGLVPAKSGGVDGYLLSRVTELGAVVIRRRVTSLTRNAGRLEVETDGGATGYDLVIGAAGVNSTAWSLFRRIGLSSPRPVTTRAYITELPLPREEIVRCTGDAMHIFLLPIPRLEFAAIIPKADVLTVCLLGRNIDREMIDAFFGSPAVRRRFHLPPHTRLGICRCAPCINIGAVARPFADRVVLVGDAGVTRLYKDGIGAAYRTARAAAMTALFSGVSAHDFRRHYWPVYRSIDRDNRFGRILFFGARQFTVVGPLLRGLLATVAREQAHPSIEPRMSLVLWDMFTGSAPYRDIFKRALDVKLLGRFLEDSLRLAVRPSGERPGRTGRATITDR